MTARHWTRPLRSGGIEFFFAASGQTMQGSAASDETYDFLRAAFERQTGTALPVPEIKPMRGGRRARTTEAA